MNRRNRKAHQMAAKRALDTETMKQLKQHVSQEINSSKYYLEECAEISISKLAGQIKQDDFEQHMANQDDDDLDQRIRNVINADNLKINNVFEFIPVQKHLLDQQRVLINRLITALVAVSIIALIFFGFTWWLS